MRKVRYGGRYGGCEYVYEFEVPDNMSGYAIYGEVEERNDGMDYDSWWATNPPINAPSWIDRGSNTGMKCSECGFPIRYKNALRNTHAYYYYCPKCGVPMGLLLHYTKLNDKEWSIPVDNV